eukprot:TRINITY_DN10734_c0_g1_i2.p1 TRINITY_DN10734_c0_g1~~TRINITY_DN10734_c0_g1_i2.p1  ORF type:complete len:299 (+),score=37.84 TRINITY_DN10734_c0_g1_i2:224-1120(+)
MSLNLRSVVKACVILTSALILEDCLMVGMAEAWKRNLRSKLAKIVVLRDEHGYSQSRLETLSGAVQKAELIKTYLDHYKGTFKGGSMTWARDHYKELHDPPKAKSQVIAEIALEAMSEAAAARAAKEAAERSAPRERYTRPRVQESKSPALDSAFLSLPGMNNLFPASLAASTFQSPKRSPVMPEESSDQNTTLPFGPQVGLGPTFAGWHPQRPKSASGCRPHVGLLQRPSGRSGQDVKEVSSPRQADHTAGSPREVGAAKMPSRERPKSAGAGSGKTHRPYSARTHFSESDSRCVGG